MCAANEQGTRNKGQRTLNGRTQQCEFVESTAGRQRLLALPGRRECAERTEVALPAAPALLAGDPAGLAAALPPGLGAPARRIAARALLGSGEHERALA